MQQICIIFSAQIVDPNLHQYGTLFHKCHFGFIEVYITSQENTILSLLLLNYTIHYFVSSVSIMFHISKSVCERKTADAFGENSRLSPGWKEGLPDPSAEWKQLPMWLWWQEKRQWVSYLMCFLWFCHLPPKLNPCKDCIATCCCGQFRQASFPLSYLGRPKPITSHHATV